MSFLQSVSIILFISFLTISCGSSGDSTSTDITQNISSRNVNGFMLTSVRKYDASGKLLSTSTYSINKKANIITLSSTSSGDKTYFYYNEKGQFIKIVHVDESDTDAGGNYSSSSLERYYTYNDLGLLTERTTDNSIDGDIDTSQIWQYDSNGYVNTREYDSDNDGFIDVTSKYVWANGNKISRIISESDGSSTTLTWGFNTNSSFPVSFNKDESSDGSIEESRQFEYDTNGNLSITRVYNKTGELIFYYERDFQSTGSEVIENLDIRNWYFF
jgi:hypothetical protein